MTSTNRMALEFAHPQDLDHLQLRLRQLERQASNRLDRMKSVIPHAQAPADPLADDDAAPLRRYLREEIDAIATEVDYLDWAQALAQVDRSAEEPAIADMGRRIGEARGMIRDLEPASPYDGTVREAARMSVKSAFRSAYARRRFLSIAWTSPMIFLLLGLNIASQSNAIKIAAICLAMVVVLVGNWRIDREFDRMIRKAEAKQDRLDLGRH